MVNKIIRQVRETKETNIEQKENIKMGREKLKNMTVW